MRLTNREIACCIQFIVENYIPQQVWSRCIQIAILQTYYKSYWHARYIFPWQKKKNDTKFSKEFIIKIKDRHYRKLTGILPENRTRDYTNRWSTHRLAIFNWLSIGSNLTELSKTSPESSTSPLWWKRKKNEELRRMVLTPTKPTYIRISEN